MKPWLERRRTERRSLRRGGRRLGDKPRLTLMEAVRELDAEEVIAPNGTGTDEPMEGIVW